MLLEPDLQVTGPKKVRDWSPIDRMLASRTSQGRSSHGRKTSKPVLSSVAGHLLADSKLPPMPPVLPPSPVRVVECEAQTEPWVHLVEETAGPAIRKVAVLEAELQRLQQQATVQAAVPQVPYVTLDDHQLVKAELAALREQCISTQSVHEEAARRWEVERRSLAALCEEWQNESTALREEQCRALGDVLFLRTELEACRKERDARCAEVKEVKAENVTLSKERDMLLQRLEVEQAEIMNRVEALDARSKVRGTRASV